MKQDKGVVFCPSVTTRPPRPGEIDGEDYHFTCQEEFFSLIERDELIEWANVYGNYYGTPGKAIDMALGSSDVIVEKDVQGARTLRAVYPEGIYIFVLPPSFEELKRRIGGRGTEKEHEMDLRLQGARQEISDLSSYDYVIINADLDRAKERLVAIVAGERRRRLLAGEPLDGEGRASNGKPTAKGTAGRISVQTCDCGGQKSEATGVGRESSPGSGSETCHQGVGRNHERED